MRAHTLCQLETCLGRWVPPHGFPKAAAKANSRDRHYTRWRTFGCMLWQGLNPGASGREVVRQLQACFRLENGPALSEDDGAYCRAKARLPGSEFPKVLTATAAAAGRLAPAPALLQGRPLKAVDGSTTTLADPAKNRKAYPPLQCAAAAGPSFPMRRFVVLFVVSSGAIAALAQGSLAVSELSLFHSLFAQLSRGDIVVGDRGFGGYPVVAWLQTTLGVDFLGRTTRDCDGRRRHQRLGANDGLLVWRRGPKPSPWLSLAPWLGWPETLTVRVVKGRCAVKGFRVRQLTVVPTLLDAQRYPAREILEAYLRRWRLELCLADLKTTLQMHTLRGLSPAMVQKELYVRLIAHNLLRCLLAQAAAQAAVPLDRLSFKGGLDALRQFAHALPRGRSRAQRAQLWAGLLRTLAADLVPLRPGRREPRAVKRQKNKYPRLNVARQRFRDRPKRHVRRTIARLRRLGLM